MDQVWAYTAVLLGLAWLAIYWKLTLKQETYLQGLCLGLPPGQYRRMRRKREDGRWLRIYSYDSTYHARQFRVEYRYCTLPAGSLWKWRLVDELDIQLPVVQKFWLRILPRKADLTDQSAAGRLELDPAFLVHSNQPDAASEFLRSEFVREQFRGLLVSFDRLEIHRGWLKLQVSPSRIHFRRSDLERSLEMLTRLALDYTERSMNFRVVVMGNSELCPYCRGTLAATEERVVECRLCRTRVHGSCWLENGQCTTWGCESTAAD